MAFDSKWGPGCDPIAVGTNSYSATKGDARRLGRRAYHKAVAATACAAMANALSATAVPQDEALDTCKSIILAARHVEALASRDLEVENGEDRRAANSWASSLELSPLAKLERVVASLRERHQQQKQQNQSTRAKSASSGPAATSGATTSTNTAAPSSTFPLPPAVLPALLPRLDARSAAALSACCRASRTAYLQQTYHQLPELFSLYIQTASNLANQDDFSDGFLESKFVVKHPLDGSIAGGADLVRSQGVREFRRVRQQVRLHFPSFAEGATLPQAPDNTRWEAGGTLTAAATRATQLASRELLPFSRRIKSSVRGRSGK